MMIKLLCLLASCLFLLSCNSCEWVSSEPLSYSSDVLWSNMYQVVNKRYEVLKASEANREIETEWQKKMSIHYLDSYRTKAYIRIQDYEPSPDDEKDLSKPIRLTEENPSGAQQYLIQVCVKKEQNRAIDNPQASFEADWFPVGADFEEAQLLLNCITIRLHTMHPTDEKNSEPTPPSSKNEAKEQENEDAEL